jgi:hypothetical protein
MRFPQGLKPILCGTLTVRLKPHPFKTKPQTNAPFQTKPQTNAPFQNETSNQIEISSAEAAPIQNETTSGAARLGGAPLQNKIVKQVETGAQRKTPHWAGLFNYLDLFQTQS